VAVATRSLPVDALERLARVAPVEVWQHRRPPSSDELRALSTDATVIVCTSAATIDAAVLGGCGRLGLVASVSAGTDHIDLVGCERRGIRVTNTPGVLHEATADLTWALILATARRVVEAALLVRSGGWERVDLDVMVGTDIHGGRLGLVGYGEIARAVAARAAGFAMEVVHHSRHRGEDPGWVPLDELLRSSDVVSLHVPLTPATEALIGERELSLMKPTAILVNTSRGGVVDQDALLRALREERLFGAGLDVNVTEPLHNIADPLLALDNCIVLPHIGSASRQARAAMASLAVDNVLAFLAGAPLLTPLV
jgi:lactate dehydrogenase-like 2-hydroxyacid dehydrogenase